VNYMYVTDKKRKAMEEAGGTTESEKKVKIDERLRSKMRAAQAEKKRKDCKVVEEEEENTETIAKKHLAEAEREIRERAGGDLTVGEYGKAQKEVSKEDRKVKKAAIAYAYMADGKTTGTEVLDVVHERVAEPGCSL
jgi:hypothetical protein